MPVTIKHVTPCIASSFSFLHRRVAEYSFFDSTFFQRSSIRLGTVSVSFYASTLILLCEFDPVSHLREAATNHPFRCGQVRLNFVPFA